MLVGARLKCIEAAGIGDDEPLASAHNSKADNSKGALASAHTSKADNSKANTGCSRAKNRQQSRHRPSRHRQSKHRQQSFPPQQRARMTFSGTLAFNDRLYLVAKAF